MAMVKLLLTLPADKRRTSRIDATDFERLSRFFNELLTPIDHVLVTGPGPYYAPLTELDFERARQNIDAHLLLPIHVACDHGGQQLLSS